MSDQKPKTNDGSAVGVTTRLKLKPTDREAAAPFLTNLAVNGTKFAGLLNVEVSPPTPLYDEWVIVQRFKTESQAIAWRDSIVRKEALAQLAPYLVERGVADETSQQQCDGSVAACISSLVKPGLEDDYYTWLYDIQTAQALAPGYQGTYLQMQKQGEASQWTTMIRFNTPEALEQWFASTRRLELIDQAKKFISSESIKRMTSSFPGWLPETESGESPANWKGAALVLIGLYPIVCLQIRFLSPALSNMQLALANFFGNLMSVSLCTWLTMPFLTTIFATWLLPPKDGNRTAIELIGLAAVIVIYVGEVLLFWNLIP